MCEYVIANSYNVLYFACFMCLFPPFLPPLLIIFLTLVPVLVTSCPKARAIDR